MQARGVHGGLAAGVRRRCLRAGAWWCCCRCCAPVLPTLTRPPLQVTDTLDAAFCEKFLATVPSSAFCEASVAGGHCFSATDETCAGTEDLTAAITVGEMERLPDKTLTWRVAHTVCDATGNCAEEPAYQYITVKPITYAAQLLGEGVTFTVSWATFYVGSVAAAVALAAVVSLLRD